MPVPLAAIDRQSATRTVKSRQEIRHRDPCGVVRVADADFGIERPTKSGEGAPVVDVAATWLEGLCHIDSFHEPEGEDASIPRRSPGWRPCDGGAAVARS